LVSEAFYFSDPEGNGVELYTNRDRDLWARTSRFEIDQSGGQPSSAQDICGVDVHSHDVGIAGERTMAGILNPLGGGAAHSF